MATVSHHRCSLSRSITPRECRSREAVFCFAISVIYDAASLRDRWLWGQLALTGLFNIGLFQIYMIAGIATLEPSRTPLIT